MKRASYDGFNRATSRWCLRLDGVGPRYAQITRALGGLIQSGELGPGSRVPATRELARDLGCSRNIVLLAYEQLALEGYLVTRTGGGTFVSPELPAGLASAPRADGGREVDPLPARLSSNGRRLVEIAAEAREITRGRGGWASISCTVLASRTTGRCRASARRLRRPCDSSRSAIRTRPATGRLRLQLAERLRGVRGIARTADEIVVTGGAQQALDMCARLLLTEGDRVVVEEPGYEGATAPFQAAGATLVRGGSTRTASIRRRCQKTERQSGSSTSRLRTSFRPARSCRWRGGWRCSPGPGGAARYIIEDDYNGEFRYAGKSIEALTALDPDGPVIYCGTLAKSFFPSLRLGYLVLPKALVPAVVACKWLSDRGARCCCSAPSPS